MDILFLINFMMDFFILWVVKQILKEKVSLKRLIMGAAFGAMALCLLIFSPSFLHNLIAYILISLVMVLISFGYGGFRVYIKKVVLTYLVAICLGGTGIFLFYYTRVGGLLGNFILFQLNNMSWKLLLASIILSFALIKFFMYYFGRYIMNKKQRFPITIWFKGGSRQLMGLVDTGNTLVDPFTDYPVVVVESSKFKDLLPQNQTPIVKADGNINMEEWHAAHGQSDIEVSFRLIPFSSLGKNNGFLLGFKPDYILIHGEKEDVKYEDVIIGIANKKLASDSSFHALIHPALVP